MSDITINETKTMQNEDVWTVGLYISALVPLFPFSNIVMPLIMWMLKRKESDCITKHGKNVLNFQITYMLALVICGILGIVLSVIFVGFFFIFAAVILVIANYVVNIIAGIKAINGEYYELPYKFKFIK